MFRHLGKATTGSAESGAHTAHLRLHNRRRIPEVFFMISKRPLLELSTEDALLYSSIGGCRTVDQPASSSPWLVPNYYFVRRQAARFHHTLDRPLTGDSR
jgi:hypothetical protein